MINKLHLNQAAPNVKLSSLDGRSVHLANYWGNGRSVLLIFLRHLAWLPCRDHVAQVASRYEEIQAAQADVVTVSFDTPYWSHIWLQETNSPFPFLVDTERAAYRAYGLDSSMLRSWSPANLLYYAKALVKKRETYGKRGDTSQLGGDFIIDPHGKIQLAHPSREPTDRPPIEALLKVLLSDS